MSSVLAVFFLPFFTAFYLKYTLKLQTAFTLTGCLSYQQVYDFALLLINRPRSGKMTEKILSHSLWSNTLNFSDISTKTVIRPSSTSTSASGTRSLQDEQHKENMAIRKCFIYFVHESKHANLACHISRTTTEANVCSIQGHVRLERRMAELAMKKKKQ